MPETCPTQFLGRRDYEIGSKVGKRRLSPRPNVRIESVVVVGALFRRIFLTRRRDACHNSKSQ